MNLRSSCLVKDGIKKALREHQDALGELVDAVRMYRKPADSKPLTLQENDYAQAASGSMRRLTGPMD